MKYRFMVLIVLLACVSGASAWAPREDVHGFVDLRAGSRLQNDVNEKDTSLAEARLQLETEFELDRALVELRSDFLYDFVPDDFDLNLRKGKGAIDLRTASVQFTPVDFADVKLGRQVLTWGTGDLLFINDMFPKDWQSFFIGRDEEYLKAPSDAIFLSLFPGFVNIDIAYSARLDADRYISGERISYWNPGVAGRVGDENIVDPQISGDWFDQDEISLRISKNISGYEVALYGYDGYWKNPLGMDTETGRAYFPPLSVYGASVRLAMGKGLINFECGYYDSKDDRSGDDPYIPNGEMRLLAGYERELMRDLSLGLQYYLEYMDDYDDYLASNPAGMPTEDGDRHVVTARITHYSMNQNLLVSLFIYFSPSDEDYYLRPAITYKASDAWMLTAGGNVFGGVDDYTFFGQFEKNNNVYAGVRYSF